MEELFYKIMLRVLLYSGLGKPMTSNIVLQTLYKLYTASVLFIFFTFTISQYIYLVNYSGNIFEMLQALSVTVLYTINIVKVKIIKEEKYVKLRDQIHTTEEAILENNDDGQKDILMNTIRYNHILSKLCIACSFGDSVLVIIKPLILFVYMGTANNSTQNVELDLPFGAWMPFDTHKYYSLAFSFQLLGGTCGSLLITSANMTFWSLLIFAIGCLRILQYRLKSLANVWEESNGVSQEIRERRIYLMFKKCVLMHQFIIQYIDELNRSINLVMLIDFAVFSFLLAITGFLTVSTGFGLPQFFDLQSLVTLLVELCMFYWHGNEIIIESLGVSDAAYESGFYNYPKMLQKDLMFLMLRAQKPLQLTVGPLYIMSTATAVTIIRAAYSYITVMRELYN